MIPLPRYRLEPREVLAREPWEDTIVEDVFGDLCDHNITTSHVSLYVEYNLHKK